MAHLSEPYQSKSQVFGKDLPIQKSAFKRLSIRKWFLNAHAHQSKSRVVRAYKVGF